MTEKKRDYSQEYERIADKADRGVFTLVEPLDYLILQHLNPAGTTFANLYPLAHTSKQINEQALGGALEIQIIGNRMMQMDKQGLVVKVVVPGNSGNKSYQRTERGTKVLTEWQAKQETTDGGS